MPGVTCTLQQLQTHKGEQKSACVSWLCEAASATTALLYEAEPSASVQGMQDSSSIYALNMYNSHFMCTNVKINMHIRQNKNCIAVAGELIVYYDLLLN